MRIAPILLLLASVATPAIVVAQTTEGTEKAEAKSEAYNIGSTSVGTLLDLPAAKAILDKHLPGLTSHPQIEAGRGFSLKQVQQFAPDQITDEALAKVQADFDALVAGK